MRGRERESLPIGNTRRVSVKSTLEEDGLKLSECSFLNVESFADTGTEVRCSHGAAPTTVYFYSRPKNFLCIYVKGLSLFVVSQAKKGKKLESGLGSEI